MVFSVFRPREKWDEGNGKEGNALFSHLSCFWLSLQFFKRVFAQIANELEPDKTKEIGKKI